jgi:hypothetical protein
MLFLVLHWWCVENPLPGNFFDQSHHPMRKWLFGDLGALCAFGIHYQFVTWFHYLYLL